MIDNGLEEDISAKCSAENIFSWQGLRDLIQKKICFLGKFTLRDLILY